MENLHQFGGEHWLPKKHSPKILSPCVEGLADAKVNSFIDQEHKLEGRGY